MCLISSTMAHGKPLSIYFFVLILCPNIITGLQQFCDPNSYIIRSTHPSGLVLDAGDPPQIKINRYNHFPTQLWTLEPATRPGLYYITNNYFGSVIDFRERPDGVRELILNTKKYGTEQQWSITLNNTITNAASFQNIDLDKGYIVPGSRVVLSNQNGHPYQEFVLEKGFQLLQVVV